MKLLILSILVTAVCSSSELQDVALIRKMLQSLSTQTGDRRERLDPLLRELMVSALERSQDERDKNNFSPPEYRQNPLLRQLRQNVVDSFADMILQLPPRNQSPLLRILRPDGKTDREIENLLPPSPRQNPLLRQLISEFSDDFLSSLSVPAEHQDPLLRQLNTGGITEDFLSSLSVPTNRQNPLLRQLAQSSQSDQGSYQANHCHYH